ncbi:bifunctional phosphopantothenoylcysteine decarboxylase/phosphopantothenate--cysteine ligase CoaBC [Alkalihalobacillus oceani]|uniref:Coenzyme A biosynthesis bifunctional protein CoaBC n=1 Tax=Halalkalibacter oceani TaxID=1653776 RepID=A0A9X2DPQ9_9BACI|nr:bifunctional phosphopantothenoylcysteine decarboxylase/phosphopantothenate--cysteine ligase CoaBC [Halalkalibacter oceani]MCM3713142.1 bifunctional phosphopantothenoylcysteine decarboxylase/phosphopantothenate--cysteine ligase CoaBC [Halalkalibacter oceani]
MLKGKKVLLAVSGGIAAFKAAALTSKLVQAGAEVKVMMTKSAQEFVTPLTFQALSRQPVYLDTFQEPDPTKIAHIEIADWADVVVIAPATANMIAKLAQGLADDLVTTTLLATKAPVYLAPAMNVNMYEHPAVSRNLETLQKDGYRLIEGEAGYLACGWTGRGRMAEPDVFLAVLDKHFAMLEQPRLKGKKVVVTAGPTQEKIDPVRYFTNHSSGKMGYAIAEQAQREGADVILISGPTALPCPKGVKRVAVETAQEMYEAVTGQFADADIVIKAAAVADYRPKEVFTEKRKKQPGEWAIEMERTIDILKTLGEQKQSQLLVGFAAESEKVEEYAAKKLEAKNLDLIVANDISASGAGFKGDTNIITILTRDGKTKQYPLLSKQEAARRIFDELLDYMKRQQQS